MEGSRLFRLALAISIALTAVAFAAPAQATFIGENGKLAFVRYHGNENGDIWTVNADGTGLTRLTNAEVRPPDTGGDEDPRWSPDGRKILFEGATPTHLGGNGIYTMNADGAALTRLHDRGHAHWLPDGRVLFSALSPAPGLYTVNADGTGKLRIGPDPGSDLSLSLDGTRLVFGPCDVDSNFELAALCTTNLDGTDRDWLVQGPRSEFTQLAWRPGARIVFGRNLPAGGIDLFTISPDGGQETRLTDDAESINIEPEWSPDGSRVIFLSDRGSRFVFDIHAIRGDGRHRMNLTRSSDQSENSASWSPDSRSVVFTNNANGLSLVDADGARKLVLTTQPPGEEDTNADWQPLLRSSFENAASFCRAHREAIGRTRFAARYGRGPKGAGAFGRCVRTTG